MNNVILTAILTNASLFGFDENIWQKKFEKSVFVDKQKSEFLRFVRKDGKNAGLYGEHLSFVIDPKNQQIKSFVRLEARHKNSPLPSQEEAMQISNKFLQKIAPDLLQNRKILWVDKHDEIIEIISNDEKIQKNISGIKVKSRNTKTGLYFWTIVDANKEVYIFERDIKWIVFPGKRGTEKWLHDAWLDEKWGGELPDTD